MREVLATVTRRRNRNRSQAADTHPVEGNGLLQLARDRSRRAERALLQYWRLLDAIFETVPDMFALKDRRGVYQAAGPSFCRFAGLDENAIRGHSDHALFPAAMADALRRFDLEVMRGMRPKTWEERIDSGNACRVVRISKTPVPGERGTCAGILCALRDVTETHQLAEQNSVLIHVVSDPFWVLDLQGNILDVSHGYCAMTGYPREKLIGQNAGGHPVLAASDGLATIRQRLSRARVAVIPVHHRTHDGRMLELIAHSTRLNVNGGRILQFFQVTAAPARSIAPKPPEDKSKERGNRPKARVISLNDIVRTALDQQNRRITPGLRIGYDLHSDLWDILADPFQILQVFTNLLTNAIEAIENRGSIRISTRNVEVVEELAMLYPHLKPGRYAMVSVEDSGKGIGPELLGKIFDPFITTKEHGSGMGLAMAQRNVRNHGGHITVRSQAGKGSTFCVFLPATELRHENNAKSGILPIGSETVLLTDEEPHVLSTGRRMLERLGYRVVTANNMREALVQMHEYPESLDLAVFDTAMPELDDPNFIKRVRRLRPDIRIVLSGNQELDEMTQDLLDAGAVTYVRKPFRVEVFAPRIRQALDHR